MQEVIPVCRISRNSIVQYQHYTGSKSSSAKERSLANLEKKETNGFMSYATKAKVKRMLEVWIESVECKREQLKKGSWFRNSKLTFVTLTLSAKQQHSDNWIKRNMLNRFIVTCTREGLFRNYFWRAEPQKNGNIHFHLIVDSYIHWKTVQLYWNDIQDTAGYIDMFEAKNGHRNPNSTDIHGFEKVQNVGAYVVKYCTKTEDARKIEGRIWGCSDDLRKLSHVVLEEDSQTSKFIAEVKESNNTEICEGDYFCMTRSRNILHIMKKYHHVNTIYTNHYLDVYTSLYEVTEEQRLQRKSAIERAKREREETEARQIQKSEASKILRKSQLVLNF